MLFKENMKGHSGALITLKESLSYLNALSDIKDFEELSFKVPQIIKLDPSALKTMADLDNAGGIPAVLKT